MFSVVVFFKFVSVRVYPFLLFFSFVSAALFLFAFFFFLRTLNHEIEVLYVEVTGHEGKRRRPHPASNGSN